MMLLKKTFFKSWLRWFVIIGTISTSTCTHHEMVGAKVVVITRNKDGSQALTLGSPPASATFQVASGTYGSSCTSHANGDPWNAGIGSYTPGSNILAVARGNTACALTLTSVQINNESTVYTVSPSIVIGTSYAGSSSSFTNGGTTYFYGNIVADSLSFTSNFTLTLYTSKDINSSPQGSNTAYATVTYTGTNAAPNVPAYTLDLTGMNVQVNAQSMISTATGSVTLTNTGQTADHYVIDSTLAASPTPTYAQINTAYNAGVASTVSGNPSITASSLNLANANLFTGPVVRSIILLNGTGGTSYLVITISFTSSQLASPGPRWVSANTSFASQNYFFGAGFASGVSTIYSPWPMYRAIGGEKIRNIVAIVASAKSFDMPFEIVDAGTAGQQVSASYPPCSQGTCTTTCTTTCSSGFHIGSSPYLTVTIPTNGQVGSWTGPSVALTAGHWYYIRYEPFANSNPSAIVRILMEIE